MANGNPFYVPPGNQFAPGLQSLAGGVERFGQQRRVDEQLEQEQEALEAEQDAARAQQQQRQAAVEAFQSGDPQAIRQASIQFPEMGQAAREAFGFTNEQTENIARQTYRQALSETDPERRSQIMQRGIEQVAQAGGQPTMMTSDLQMLQENPEAFDRSARAGYAALASEEEFEAMFGGEGGGAKIGTYNPRDYTTQSFAEFQKTGDPAVLERYASQRSVDIGGVPHVFDPAMGGYRPAGVAGADGQQPITAETVAGSEARIKGETERAKQDVKSQSPAEQRQQREAIKSTRQEIATAQDTISQIDNLMGNERYIEALTGVRGKLPGAPGTAGFDAEVAFDQFRNSLTLENLGKMSGVLSESDIRILESAASGIQQGMSEDAFKARMETIRNVLEGKSQDARSRLEQIQGGGNSEQGGAQMSEEEADAFIDSMLEQ